MKLNCDYMFLAECAVKTTNGECCVFPFIYEGKTYSACTKVGYSSHWCSTTGNLDLEENKWGRCQVRSIFCKTFQIQRFTEIKE